MHAPGGPERVGVSQEGHARAAHLADSASGPTGDLDSSSGELPSCTSWSRLRDSFLSKPASLPAAPAARVRPRRRSQARPRPLLALARPAAVRAPLAPARARAACCNPHRAAPLEPSLAHRLPDHLPHCTATKTLNSSVLSLSLYAT